MRSHRADIRPLALTMGEPAGIGGDLTLSAWLRRDEGLPPFLAIDDPQRLESLASHLGWKVPIVPISVPGEAIEAFAQGLPVLAQPLAAPSVPGHPTAENVAAVSASIETAVTLARQGQTAGVVTNPIHKAVMYQGGFHFPGHTEFIASLLGLSGREVMMLACPELRVVPVTIHVALAQAARDLTGEAVVACGRTTAWALRHDFAIDQPRLAVAALNPHAGEDGSMGREEIEIIAPAIARLRAEGIDATGPWPSDTLFHPAARATYDAVLCMYHDQALIPLKTIDFDGGVNITLGLPIVRTSPDHGTALALAGTGRANPASLMAALRMGGQMAANRAASGRKNA